MKRQENILRVTEEGTGGDPRVVGGDSPGPESLRLPPAAAVATTTTTTEPTVPGSHLETWRKYLILFVVSWNCLVITSCSTSLLVAGPEVAASLHTTTEIINITNSGVLLAMGWSSLLWSPLGQVTSRRISYNLAIFVTFAASIGTALAPDMATFTAMRVLSGLTGTYFMVAGQTFIADIFEPVKRGRAVGCLMVGGVAGTAIGPCIAGIILTYSHWRSIYWLQVAQAGLGLIISLISIPDIHSEVKQLYEKNDDEKEGTTTATTTEKKSKREKTKQILQTFNPARVFRLFLRPQLFLADLACGFLAVTQYGILTSVRAVINPRFGLTTPLVSGLFYIAPGVGFIVGSLVGGRMSDASVRSWITKREGKRLPRDRLNSGFVHFFVVLPISMMLYGWSLQAQFGGLALPIVCAFWIGTGLMGAWNGLNTFTAEVFPSQRAESVSSKYVLQYVFGAASTAAILPLITAIGVGWSFTIFTVLVLMAGGLVVFIARFAPYDGVWAYKG